MDYLHKYPRTWHLPWSESLGHDDVRLESVDFFEGKEVVVTEKMDGENTSMYCNHIHARSLDSGPHVSRDWVRGFWATFKHDIPVGWRICGENLFAKHSIHYKELESLFMGFSCWDSGNRCLSWTETLDWFKLLGISSVPVLYSGQWDRDLVVSLWSPHKAATSEGYVVRLSGSFPYQDFNRSVAKFVRRDHITTSTHWLKEPVVRNLCR